MKKAAVIWTENTKILLFKWACQNFESCKLAHTE